MTWFVQKFGGTSLADVDRIRRCAGRVASAHLEGHRVVVVVSAMAHTTDDLLALAGSAADRPDERELDMLLATGEHVSVALMSLALRDHGIPVESFTAHDLGISTDERHGEARIESVDARALAASLEVGAVAVVPGFVGLGPDGAVTTLGRGGSDTTAVAIAAALREHAPDAVVGCEIYTDVEGVFTADPREILGARPLDTVTYEEMTEMAALGARVLQPRAVILAQRHGLPIHVRHSTHPEPGTLIVKERPMERDAIIGCAMSDELGRLNVTELVRTAEAMSIVVDAVGRAGVRVDEILQIERDETIDLCLAVPATGLADARDAARAAVERLGGAEITVDVGFVKVSIVGVGLRSDPSIAATMLRALAGAGIDVAAVTTSEMRMSCLVSRDRGAEAMEIVHEAFGLSETPVLPATDGIAVGHQSKPAC